LTNKVYVEFFTCFYSVITDNIILQSLIYLSLPSLVNKMGKNKKTNFGFFKYLKEKDIQVSFIFESHITILEAN